MHQDISPEKLFPIWINQNSLLLSRLFKGSTQGKYNYIEFLLFESSKIISRNFFNRAIVNIVVLLNNIVTCSMSMAIVELWTVNIEFQ